MGLVDKIKNDVKKSGQNKSKFLFVREGVKTRIRFLTDMDDGMEIQFHDSFAQSITVPCQEKFGRSCSYCEQEGLRTRSQYAWSVWDYEAKEVKLFIFPVNNCSPVPAIMSMFENYGTITDRDYIITVSGKQKDKTYGVVPMDKNKFRNDKAKPLSEKAILKLLDKAYPADDENEDEDEEEEIKSNKSKAKKPSKPEKSSKKSSKKDEDEDEDEDYEYDDDDADDEEEDELDYSEMSAKDLYKLCKERKIDVQPKKQPKYYINLLKEYDEAQEDWGEDDDEDEDEWEDD